MEAVMDRKYSNPLAFTKSMVLKLDCIKTIWVNESTKLELRITNNKLSTAIPIIMTLNMKHERLLQPRTYIKLVAGERSPIAKLQKLIRCVPKLDLENVKQVITSELT